MTDPTWRCVTEEGSRFAAAAAADPKGLLLACDFDGTLSPVVDDPESAEMLPAAAEALSDLVPRVGKFAIITGRGVAAVRRLGKIDERPALASATILGQYGVERFDGETGAVRNPPPPAGVAAAKRDLVSLLAELAAAGQSVAGVYVEDKQRALGVHTRRCDEPVRAFELLQPLVAEIGVRHDLQVEPGKLVIELRSASLSKADALTELVDEYQPTSVVMIGDDLGDLPAFRLLPELRERGIVSCGVVSASQEQPALLEYADVLCDGPVGVADWLSQLASELG